LEPSPSIEYRVLLRTATAKDAIMTSAVLRRAGLLPEVCNDLRTAVREIASGAGALLLAEEVLDGDGAVELSQWLAQQPDWSDLPVLVLARPGADSHALAEAMDQLANVTVLERPMRVASLVSALRSALRARKRQYELRHVLAGLREADQRKTEFLATLAHELRNPMAPLSTALAVLKRTMPTPEAAAPYYDMMTRQLEHMVRLVNDLMEVSRITRGKIDLRLEPLALDRVIQDAVELSRPLMDVRRHRLAVQPADASLFVQGDAVRLTQVFSNLLNNAAKYTPEGGEIDIRIARQGSRALVTVQDDGLGIEPHMLASIFDMFVQVSGTARAAQGGLGIGLTLVKTLVGLHGGLVTAHSDGLHRGSRFDVMLPLALAPSSQDRPLGGLDRAASLDVGSPVLVVDDNRDAADSLCEVLNLMGARAVVAYSGDEALRVAAQVQPQVAILDIGMPGMDGYELAAALRAHAAHRDLVLIALTGWGQQTDRQRIAQAGFEFHLLKPVDLAGLASTLGQVAGRGGDTV
jgi:signal transduction histidine kinase/ActR/RegA family two-component response regulator